MKQPLIISIIGGAQLSEAKSRSRAITTTAEVRSKDGATKTQSHEGSQKVTKSKHSSSRLSDFVANTGFSSESLASFLIPGSAS